MKSVLRPWAAIASAFVAGTAVSFFTLPVWIMPLMEAGREGNRSDWLGFAGALVGSSLTSIVAVIAIYFASRGLRQQIIVTLYSREEDRIESILPGLHEMQQLLVSYLNEFRGFDERVVKGDPDCQAKASVLANTLPASIARELPNATAKNRQDLEMTLGLLAGSALGMVMAYNAFATTSQEVNHLSLGLPPQFRPFSDDLRKQEIEFADRVRSFRTALEIAERSLLGLNSRIVSLERRLMNYRREIERMLPQEP